MGGREGFYRDSTRPPSASCSPGREAAVGELAPPTCSFSYFFLQLQTPPHKYGQKLQVSGWPQAGRCRAIQSLGVGAFLAPWPYRRGHKYSSRGLRICWSQAVDSHHPIQCSQVAHPHYTDCKVQRGCTAHPGSHSRSVGRTGAQRQHVGSSWPEVGDVGLWPIWGTVPSTVLGEGTGGGSLILPTMGVWVWALGHISRAAPQDC